MGRWKSQTAASQLCEHTIPSCHTCYITCVYWHTKTHAKHPHTVIQRHWSHFKNENEHATKNVHNISSNEYYDRGGFGNDTSAILHTMTFVNPLVDYSLKISGGLPWSIDQLRNGQVLLCYSLFLLYLHLFSISSSPAMCGGHLTTVSEEGWILWHVLF